MCDGEGLIYGFKLLPTFSEVRVGTLRGAALVLCGPVVQDDGAFRAPDMAGLYVAQRKRSVVAKLMLC